MQRFNFPIIFHCLLLILVYITLYYFGVIGIFPSNGNILQWDALFFFSIKQEGYEFIAYRGTNLAFFPLFPFFWKLSSFSGIGISIFNACIFLGSFAFLVHKENLPVIMKMFILAIPSFIFFALPYSEALFFFFTTMIVFGYQTKSKFWLYVGFFGSSMVKSASIIFLPAIIITELYCDSTRARKAKNIFITALSSFAGMCIAASIQALQTGKWFYFIEIQQYWGRHWILPGFPLTTGDPNRILGIDGVALLLGVIAICQCIFWSYGIIRGKSIYPPSAVLFSALYLSASTVIDLFFTYNVNGSGNIWSLNRHLFCCPFSIVFLVWLYKYPQTRKSTFAALVLLVLSGIYLAGLYKYPLMTIYYLVFVITWGIFKYYPSQMYYVIGAYVINLFVQVIFFKDYLSGLWIS